MSTFFNSCWLCHDENPIREIFDGDYDGEVSIFGNADPRKRIIVAYAEMFYVNEEDDRADPMHGFVDVKPVPADLDLIEAQVVTEIR